MSSEAISKFLHTRLAALLLVALTAAGVALTCHVGDIVPLTGQKGFALPSPNTWFEGRATAGMWANLGLNLAIIGMMVLINRTYNVLRSMTLMYTGLFAIMQLATPSLLLTFNSGTLLCFAVLVCVWLLFRTYANPRSQRDVFMIFFLLSAGMAVQYCFAVYIVVFAVGCVQMRITRLRSVLAAAMGAITVWWLLLGFGIVSPANIHLPRFGSIFAAIDLAGTALLLVTVASSAFLAVASIIANVFKTIAYNARARAYSGSLALIALVTIVAMALDYTDITTYVPMLNCCAAFQVTHFFAIHRRDNAYIGVLCIVALYVILFLWRLTI